LGVKGLPSGGQAAFSAGDAIKDSLTSAATNLLSGFLGTATDVKSETRSSIEEKVDDIAKDIRTGEITEPSELAETISQAADVILDSVAGLLRIFLEQGISINPPASALPGLPIQSSVDYLLKNLDGAAAQSGLNGSTDIAAGVSTDKQDEIEGKVSSAQSLINGAEEARSKVSGLSNSILDIYTSNPILGLSPLISSAVAFSQIILGLAEAIFTAGIVGAGLATLIDINTQIAIGSYLVVNGEGSL
jgi:hypothetical protein